MSELAMLLDHLRESTQAWGNLPFPFADAKALQEVFSDEFSRLPTEAIFNADLNHFFCTIHGWAAGGVWRALLNAGERYRMGTWLSQSFFDRFSQYRFLEDRELAEYPSLAYQLEMADMLRRQLLLAIKLYESNALDSADR